jgi:hypothetical protein
MLNKLRLALAAIIMAVAAVSAADHSGPILSAAWNSAAILTAWALPS